MPETVNVDMAASLTGRTPATIRKWIREGRINAQKKLGRFLLERTEIERVSSLPELPPKKKRR